MKVLLVHERYRQPGGEDYVFEAEGSLLESRGHDVVRYTEHNDRIEDMSRIRLAVDTVWSRASREALARLVEAERPDVAHFHNTFPLISPAAYRPVADAGIAIVQTLHNFRIVCPMAQLFRDGGPCEDCVGRAVPWPGVLHACYRDSRSASVVVAAMLSAHRAIGTWRKGPDVYVALTPFARDRFVAGGLPEERIVVKPNFVDRDPGIGDGSGEHVAFVGRLSPEKGVDVLLEAWERLEADVPLRIAGDGPLRESVERAARRDPRIEWTGWAGREEVFELLRGARFAVFPSIWYETFGLGMVEAFAAGRPVIASDRGAMADLVEHARTGALVPAGDAAALSRAVADLWSDPARAGTMGERARAEYEERYAPERGYEALMRTYEIARDRARERLR